MPHMRVNMWWRVSPRLGLGAPPDSLCKTLSELAGCLASGAPEGMAEAWGSREAERIGYGLHAPVGGEQTLGMIELDVGHVRAYRAATARTKTPRQLAHGDMAQACKFLERWDFPDFLESLVYQAQPPTGQAAAG